MQRRDDDEYLDGDRRTGKNWLIIFFLYVLCLLWLEPLIDFLLSLNPPDTELAAINAFNNHKIHIAKIAFGIARSLPIILFLWLAYRSIVTERIPPKGMKIPFTVKLIKGLQAKMVGVSMITLGMILLFRELYLMVNA